MSIDKTTEVIKEYLSSCNGDTVVHIPKEHIIATLSQECSDNGIEPEVRDSHPFMKKLHEAQDGVVFTSYQDLMVFSEDLISGLPEPSTPLPVTSNELESLEAQLSREDLSIDEKKEIFNRHQETSRILNDVLMAEKRKGFFHKPKENAYFVSEESIQRYISAQKNEVENNNFDNPASHQEKSQSSQAQPPKELDNNPTNESNKDFNPLIDQYKKMHADKMKAKEQLMRQQKSGMDSHLAYRDPSREVALSLMKAGGIGLGLMSTGLNKIIESTLSKRAPSNQIFLSSIAKRNHKTVSNSINESSLAMEELGRMMGNKNPTADDIDKSHKLLNNISINTSLLSEKSRKGVLNASDREAISSHAEKIAKFLDEIKESSLSNAIDSENIKELFISIFNALRNILPGDRRQDYESNHPNHP